MDFGRLYALFIAKLYSGGLETITTIFILMVIILVLEVRRVHRLYRSAITRHTTERNTWRESIEKIQDSYPEFTTKVPDNGCGLYLSPLGLVLV